MSGCLHHQNLLHALEGSPSLEVSHALEENPFLVEILSLEESLHHHRHVSNLLHHFSLHPYEEGFLSLEVNLFLEGSHVLEESGRLSILLCHLFLHPFQASDHSSTRLLARHDPHLCAHCALFPASPPSRAP